MSWETVDDALARQPGESQPAHAAFLDYCYMGEFRRSTRKLAETYQERKALDVPVPTIRLPTLQGWSSAFKWQARIAMYDAAQRAKRVAEQQADIDAMNKRHVQIAQAAQAKVLIWLKEPENKLIRPSDVALFAKLATDLERRGRGVPVIPPELANATTDELLARYHQLLVVIRGETDDMLDLAAMEEANPDADEQPPGTALIPYTGENE